MSDILEEAEALIAKCWNEYKEEIPQREIMNGFTMLPQLAAEIKRLRADNERAERAHESLDVIRRNQIAAKDDLLAQNQITIQMHHGNVLELQKAIAVKDIELARWQKITIEERVKILALKEILAAPAEAAEMGVWPGTPFSDPPASIRGNCREQASKELQLEAAKEASYIDRLEIAFLDAYLYVIEARKCHYPGFGVDDAWRSEAQAALSKILHKV